MKKITLLMLTVMMSVFAFAQEIQQTPLPGLKKQLTAKQQVLQAKRQGMTQQNAAQFKFNKPALPQLAKKNRPALNLPVQKMEGGVKKAKKATTAKGIDRKAVAKAATRRAPGESAVVLPEGVEAVQWYVASGKCYVYSSYSGGFVDRTSSTTIKVAISGSDIYISGLGYWMPDAFIKGTIADGKATFANGQFLGEDEYGEEHLVGSDDGETDAESIIFTYDAEAGVLIAETAYLTECEPATCTNGYYSYWDQPVFTKDEPVDPRVTPPADLVTEDWTIARYFYDGESESGEEKTLQIGFYPTESGTDVYVQGFSAFSDYMEDANWIKGTLAEDGKSITFAGNQYYGSYGTYDFFFAGIDMTYALVPSITVDYDAEAGTITWPETVLILENGAEAELSPYGYFSEFVATVKGVAPEPLAAPDIVTTEWYFKSQSLSQDGETEDYDLHVHVGIAGTDVFVKGLCEDMPDAWIKGTLNPETKKVTFATGQHFGTVSFWGYTFPYFFAGYGEKGLEDVVMAFDAETKTMTMESPTYMLINAAWLIADPNLVLTDITAKEIADVAATPAQPEIVGARLTGTSYPNISVEIPDTDAEGNPLLTGKLFYQYWTEIDGVQAPLTLTPAEYQSLEADMTEIPYSFTDDWDIYNYRLYLNQDFSTWKKIGIQSIYRGGEAENKSAIAWKTIAKFSVDPEFDSSKGGISIPTMALEGETVKITVKPDNGYKVTKVTARVGKTNIKVVEEYDEETGETTYSIVAPPADVIVSAEFDVTPADFTVNVAPGNINEAIDAATEGMLVRNLTINLQAGDYTITKPIEAAGNLVINGNGAVIDAKDCVITTGEGEEAVTTPAPFIQMSKEPLVEAINDEKGELAAYMVDAITIKDLTVTGLKKALFSDNGVKYAYKVFTVDNVFVPLAEQTNVMLNLAASMAINFDIKNSTFYSVKAGTSNFIALSGKRPWQIPGYEEETGKLTVDHNTFYNIAKSKQFLNTNTLKGQKYLYVFNSNIFVDTSNKKIYGNMTNNKKQLTTDGLNTYMFDGAFFNETDYNGDEGLTTDPKFEDAANGDFSVRVKSEQAVNQTGDWNRWGEWIVDLYEIAIDIAEDANGTVKAPQYAQEDEEITLEIVPEKGYQLVEGSLKVFLGKSELEIVDNKFSMPAANVKVTAEFELATGINAVKANEQENAVIYNLQGVRVDKSQAKGGIFIVNGHKVVIK